jgi:flagellar hook-basal body complex protein FliE
MTIQALQSMAKAMSPMGDIVKLARTDGAHLNSDGQAGADAVAGPASFQDALFKAMDGVNAKQTASTDITQRMLTDPESVEPHDVTIAQAEASLSLNIARTVLNRLVTGWKEIMNAR